MAGLGNSLAARPRVAVFALVNGGGAGRGATRGHFFAHQHGEGMLSRRDFPHDQLFTLGTYGLLAAYLRAGGRLGNVPHRFRCELVLAAFFAVDRIRSRFSHLRRQRRQRKKHNKRQRHHTNDFPGFHGSLPPNLMLMDILDPLILQRACGPMNSHSPFRKIPWHVSALYHQWRCASIAATQDGIKNCVRFCDIC